MYKVGDKVKVVDYRTSDMCSDGGMDKYLDKVVTISQVDDSGYIFPYKIEEDDGEWVWEDDMFQYKLEPIYEEPKESKEYDSVEAPKHYTNKEIEPIDYMEDTLSKEGFIGFCIGNVLKYVSRYPHKNGLEDLKKAKFYLEKSIDIYEKEEV